MLTVSNSTSLDNASIKGSSGRGSDNYEGPPIRWPDEFNHSLFAADLALNLGTGPGFNRIVRIFFCKDIHSDLHGLTHCLWMTSLSLQVGRPVIIYCHPGQRKVVECALGGLKDAQWVNINLVTITCYDDSVSILEIMNQQQTQAENQPNQKFYNVLLSPVYRDSVRGWQILDGDLAHSALASKYFKTEAGGFLAPTAEIPPSFQSIGYAEEIRKWWKQHVDENLTTMIDRLDTESSSVQGGNVIPDNDESTDIVYFPFVYIPSIILNPKTPASEMVWDDTLTCLRKAWEICKQNINATDEEPNVKLTSYEPVVVLPNYGTAEQADQNLLDIYNKVHEQGIKAVIMPFNRCVPELTFFNPEYLEPKNFPILYAIRITMLAFRDCGGLVFNDSPTQLGETLLASIPQIVPFTRSRTFVPDTIVDKDESLSEMGHDALQQSVPQSEHRFSESNVSQTRESRLSSQEIGSDQSKNIHANAIMKTTRKGLFNLSAFIPNFKKKAISKATREPCNNVTTNDQQFEPESKIHKDGISLPQEVTQEINLPKQVILKKQGFSKFKDATGTINKVDFLANQIVQHVNRLRTKCFTYDKWQVCDSLSHEVNLNTSTVSIHQFL
jgi:hypothetical protein